MSSVRRNGQQYHILKTPFFLSLILVFQFVLAIVLLGLSGYGVSQYAYAGFGLSLFTSLATLIIAIYIILATELIFVIYNYWAILALHCFLVLFWLCSFAVTASEAHSFGRAVRFCFDDGFFRDGSDCDYTYRNVLRATAVLGALQFVLFIVHLTFTAVYLHRHRTAGGHCMAHPNQPVVETKGPAMSGPNCYVEPGKTYPPTFQALVEGGSSG